MVLLAFANRKGCGGSLWPEHIPRKVEQCHMKPEPMLNLQEAWALLFYKTFRSEHSPRGAVSLSAACISECTACLSSLQHVCHLTQPNISRFRSRWSQVWHRYAGFTSEARKCKRHLCHQSSSRNEIYRLLCDWQWHFHSTLTCHGLLHCENGRMLSFSLKSLT